MSSADSPSSVNQSNLVALECSPGETLSFTQSVDL